MKKKHLIFALVAVLVVPMMSLAKSDKAKANQRNQGNQGNSQHKTIVKSIEDTNVRTNDLTSAGDEAETPSDMNNRNANKGAKNDDKLEKAKEKALAAIDRRINKLETAKSQLASRKRLVEDQRTAIGGDIDKAIAALNSAKTNIQSATDINSLRTQLKNALAAAKVNAVIAPKVKAMSMVSALNNAITRLERVKPKIQEGINKLPAEKKTQAQALFDEIYNTLLPQVKTKTATAWTAFSQMRASGDAASAKTQLEAGKAAFRDAKDSIKQIVQKLNQIKAMWATMEETSGAVDADDPDENETQETTKPVIAPKAPKN